MSHVWITVYWDRCAMPIVLRGLYGRQSCIPIGGEGSTLVGYYVALVDKRSQTVKPFSEVECDSALDAAECEQLMLMSDPNAQTLIGYRPEPGEELAPHVCRGCNCQFDRNARLIA